MPPRITRGTSAPPPDICEAIVIDQHLSYNFDEIETSVRQEIHAASSRFNATLQDLKSHVAPLQELWTREAATAYAVEQLKWQQAAHALNEILTDLGNAVRDGADDVAAADHRAAGVWARQGP